MYPEARETPGPSQSIQSGPKPNNSTSQTTTTHSIATTMAENESTQSTSIITSLFSRNATPTPVYQNPTDIPRVKKAQKHLSGTRTKQLIRAAERTHNDPPVPGECCGSSCDPCVMDLWREEVAVWKERWGESANDGKARLDW